MKEFEEIKGEPKMRKVKGERSASGQTWWGGGSRKAASVTRGRPTDTK
jgi:hypothetical protein